MSNEEHEARLEKSLVIIKELLRKSSERLKFRPSWIYQLSATQPRAAVFTYPVGLLESNKAMLRELEAVRRRIEKMSQPDETP